MGFTLPELMVVIIIVGILAVLAIPIYDKMVEQSRVSEARAMIAAIVSAEKAYMQRNGEFLTISPNGADFKEKLRIDLGESAYFTYSVTSSDIKKNFTVSARVSSIGEIQGGLPAEGSLTYTYDLNNDPNPRGTWGGSLE